MDNYKNKYDEALERAKSLKTPELRDVAEYIFPELVESEDEKTRKEIINYLKKNCRLEWAAWLEKQGEQKPTVEPKFKVGDRITKSSKKSCPVHSSIDDTICEVAEVHDTCYILNTKEGRIQVPLEWQDNYELTKPTWSEEDDKMFRNLNSLIYVVRDSDCDSKEKLKLSVWLKSLKELVKNKKENETNKLSEEDINNLNRISTILYEAGQVQCWWKEERLIPKEESDYLCDWLKSLYNKLKL